MKKVYIILDDGHGECTPGKRSPIFEEDTKLGSKTYCAGESFKENEFNSKVVDKAYEKLNTPKLREEGIYCVKLVPEGEDISLTERVKRAKKFGEIAKHKGATPFLVSVHANAHATDYDGDQVLDFNKVEGVDSFFYKKDKEQSEACEELAWKIQKILISKTNAKDRGVKGRNFMILRELYPTNVYPVLIECGFMTNLKELKKLATVKYQDQVASAIIEYSKSLQDETSDS